MRVVASLTALLFNSGLRPVVAPLASLTALLIFIAIAAACGGASDSNLFGEVPNSTVTDAGSSGASTSSSSGSSGASSSGAICETSPCDGTSTSSSGAVVDSGVDSGPPPGGKCSVNVKDACLPSEYCKVDGCVADGVCTRRPEAKNDYGPVCGCDGVTYWNATIAGARGANVAANDSCGGNPTCTKNEGCTGDQKCNLEQTLCTAIEPKGKCWQLPASCEGVVSRKVRRCNNLQCVTLCEALAEERQFTAGAACP